MIPEPAVLVAYSGGKDSLVMIDLCQRAGKRVEAFHMYFLPGMELTADICGYAERRFGIQVRQYQHWGISYYFRRGVFCEPDPDFPIIKIGDIERAAREDSGLEWISYGYKKIDSLQRRGMLSQGWPAGINERRKSFTLISEWTNTQIHAYLSRRNITVPGVQNGKRGNGMDLMPDCLAWLKREYPSDFRLLLNYFPYAEAQAERAPAVRAYRDRKRAEAREKRKCLKSSIETSQDSPAIA